MDLFSIDYLHISIRLLGAGILGGLIGWEREISNHPAGFRTHILVCMGSTLIMLLSIYGFSDWMEHENVRADPARLAAQVISGIGFLGAGTILRHGFNVTGLTTAASLWVVAGIGLAVGAGFYYAAIFTTFLVLVSLVFLNRMERFLIKHRRLRILKVKVTDEPGKLGLLATFLGEKKLNIQKVSIENEEGANEIEITFTLKEPPNTNFPEIIQQIHRMDGVQEVTLHQ
jgi:putative Mg2+ transporter-C (MgtC) family protein